MKKNIIIFVLVLIVSALLYIFIYKDDIMHQLRENEKVAHIGEKISDNLMVFDANKEPKKIRELIQSPTTVFLYSDTCPPCRTAVSDLNDFYENKIEPVDRELIVIVFADKIPNSLLSYKNLQAFNIKKSRGDTIFAGSPTPVFYQFDSEAILTKKFIGWSTDFDYLIKILSSTNI